MKRADLVYSESAQSVVIGGLYEHYKGYRYRVITIARHSETLEELVVYQALYGQHDYWVRPCSLFLENILLEGTLQPRFKFIPEE